METEFYLISDLNRIGKIENYIPYLYDTGKGWMVDSDNIVMDRLMGYNEIGRASCRALQMLYSRSKKFRKLRRKAE